MGDLIDRQAAINALNDEITITGANNAYVVRDYVKRVKRKLEALPSEEPDFIRCRECKYGTIVDDVGIYYCSFHYGMPELTLDTHFCGHAERRE